MVISVQKILDVYWDGYLPVDIKTIAQRLGVECVSESSCSYNGRFQVTETGMPTISYSLSDSTIRQRFAIAHSLGHYVLNHGSVFVDCVDNYSSKVMNVDETAANNFALQILIPSTILEYVISDTKDVTISNLSSKFMVSEVAMHTRLKQLGWLSF